jgi:hypothetical protein
MYAETLVKSFSDKLCSLEFRVKLLQTMVCRLGLEHAGHEKQIENIVTNFPTGLNLFGLAGGNIVVRGDLGVK